MEISRYESNYKDIDVEEEKLIIVSGFGVLSAPKYDKYDYGLVNAGDCFSFKGNEYGRQSLESIIGDNTNIRVTQVPARNTYMVPSIVSFV